MRMYLATFAIWALFGVHIKFEPQLLRIDTFISSPFKALGINPAQYARTNFTFRKWILGLLSLIMLGAILQDILG